MLQNSLSSSMANYPQLISTHPLITQYSGTPTKSQIYIVPRDLVTIDLATIDLANQQAFASQPIYYHQSTIQANGLRFFYQPPNDNDYYHDLPQHHQQKITFT